MNIFLSILFGIAGFIAIGSAIRTFMGGSPLLALPLVYVGVIAFTWVAFAIFSKDYYSSPSIEGTISTVPLQEPSESFVSSDTCRSCHPGEYHSWHRSYHRTMTQLATEESVKGDFSSGFTAKFPNLEVRMDHDDEGFWTEYTVGNPMSFRRQLKRRVVMTTGSHHYQIYWTDEPWFKKEKENDRTVWMVPYIYHFEEQQWLPRHATFIMPFTDQPEYRRWNQTCSRCHSTYGVAKYEPLTDTHDTRTVEFGISCEACHGPGKEHIESNRNPLRRYGTHRSENGDPTIINPSKLDHRRSAEVCGRCHSNFMSLNLEKRFEWNDDGQSFRPGDVLADHLHIFQLGRTDDPTFEKLDSNFFASRFWKDGMAKVAGREYNGLLNTPCFEKGEMSCLTCHGMHKDTNDPRSDPEWADDQLKPGMRQNAACTQCHEPLAVSETLSRHTHHLPGSAGSNCYNCHMPHTTYGLLKGIRSHQITSPSVPATLETGRPNACNLCHLDRTLTWTAKNLGAWYSQPTPTLTDDEQKIAASLLWLLKGDAGQRALVASAFGRDEAREISGSDWMPPFLSQLHIDPYHAIRIISNRSLRTIKGFEEISRYPKTRKGGVEAKNIWNQQTGNHRTDAKLLLDDKGKVRTADLQRILKKRDETPIFLSE